MGLGKANRKQRIRMRYGPPGGGVVAWTLAAALELWYIPAQAASWRRGRSNALNLSVEHVQ